MILFFRNMTLHDQEKLTELEPRGAKRGTQFPGADSLRGAPKSPNIVTTTFFSTFASKRP